ncbi:hypothetical protein I3760_15G067800 [Carya illinoinensis]|nr:hypothetical protein I3760_15G067800 [Carya illinoinensis]
MKQKLVDFCRRDKENLVISEEFRSKKLEEGEASTDSVEEIQKSALDEENRVKDEEPMYNSSDSGGSTFEASSRSLLKTDLELPLTLSVKEDQLDINIGITLKDKETLKSIEDYAAVNLGEKSLVESHGQAVDKELLKASEMEKKMILSGNNGTVFERRVTEFSLGDFLCNGPLREPNKERNSLLSKIKDDKILKWEVDTDDPLGTRQQAFQQVEPTLGVNLENAKNLTVIFEPFDGGREINLVETDVLSFHSKSVKALTSLQLYKTGAFPNGFQRFFRASQSLIVHCEASNGRTTEQDFMDMAWQAIVSFQDLESYAFFDMDGNQTP